MNNPTPNEIKEARVYAGLTQKAAGELIYCSLRGWQDWELGNRKMKPALFELFLIKTSNSEMLDTLFR